MVCCKPAMAPPFPRFRRLFHVDHLHHCHHRPALNQFFISCKKNHLSVKNCDRLRGILRSYSPIIDCHGKITHPISYQWILTWFLLLFLHFRHHREFFHWLFAFVSIPLSEFIQTELFYCGLFNVSSDCALACHIQNNVFLRLCLMHVFLAVICLISCVRFQFIWQTE